MSPEVAVIGGGPAGLIAAERLSAAGRSVVVYERMPSLARKLLMAGRGGLNLTHSEDIEPFLARYGARAQPMRPWLDAFPPASLVDWAQGLGQETFVGSSGRIFPTAMKASPLLRAWLARLDAQGVRFVLRADWTGWDGQALAFADGERVTPKATLLALGGASWPRLGSNGAWAEVLAGQGIGVAPLAPANVGFRVAWDDVIRRRHAGAPLKAVEVRVGDHAVRGEVMLTEAGVEGGAVYALGPILREAVARDGEVDLLIDLRPQITREALAARLSGQKAGMSLANRLRKAARLSPAEISVLHFSGAGLLREPDPLAAAIKAVRLRLAGPMDIDRAISTAGGVRLDEVDDRLMLRRKPGVFVAGEMLDWEAPTGGYLLQACFASGILAAQGIEAWLAQAD